MNIHKVAVIGAGVMGASIAAHISNAGIPVYLLDIVPKPELSSNRNTIAETAIEKLLKAQPAPFMHKNNARLITAGNIEDHLHWLADVDWVIEAVIEKPAIKNMILGLRAKILEGFSLAQAMEDYPQVFSKLFYSTVSAGEKTGKLVQRNFD